VARGKKGELMMIPMNICWNAEECGEERPDEVVSEACLDCIYEHAVRLDESICERAGIEGPYFAFSKSSLEEDLKRKYLCGKIELGYATVVVVGGTTSSAVIQMLTLGEILDIHYSGDEGYDEIVLANEVSQGKGRFSYEESSVLKKAALEIQEEINRVGSIDNSNSIDFEERFLSKLAERLIWEDVYPTKEVEENHTYFLENMYDNLELICKYKYPRFAFRNHEKGYIEFICKDDATLAETLQKMLESEEDTELRSAAIFFLQEKYGITYGSSEEEKKLLATVIDFN
jgi:hypothetical protein